jgi:hypothetical protein
MAGEILYPTVFGDFDNPRSGILEVCFVSRIIRGLIDANNSASFPSASLRLSP